MTGQIAAHRATTGTDDRDLCRVGPFLD